MNITTTMTSKGQITLPAHIRKQTNMNSGDKIYPYIVKQGKELIVVIKKLRPLDELVKSIKIPKGMPKVEDLSWV